MALSLLSQNRCSFDGCQLYFSSLDDLIAHIEFTHITPHEDEYRHKAGQPQGCPEESGATATLNMPLSCVYRLFPVPYNPQPCASDVVRITFNHNRKRQLDDEQISTESNEEDLSECGPNEPESRHCCVVSECGKRFKTASGLRLHSSTAHGVVIHGNTLGAQPVADDSWSRISSQKDHLPPTVGPSKYAASRPYKCRQCPKRFMTTTGLSNHVGRYHGKQSGGCGTLSFTDSAPTSSPAVLDQLISQAIAQGQATAAAQEQQMTAQQGAQMVQQKPIHSTLPQVSNQQLVQLTSSNNAHQAHHSGAETNRIIGGSIIGRVLSPPME